MCIILWSPLSRSLRSSLFEVITFWTRGMLRFSSSVVCSVLPLRLKDLPLTLPLEDGLFACSGSDRGKMIGR